MKKLMKNLIKKIKEHKLFRKTSCLMVVCLLMFYMCSVSVFAAEGDEAAAQSSVTESITDVWSAVMDGFMDLINAAQGVFYINSVDSYIEFGDPVYSSSFDLNIYPLLNFPSVSVGSSFQLDFISSGDTLSKLIAIVGPDFHFGGSTNLLSYSMAAAIVSEGGHYDPFAFYDLCLGDSDDVFISGWSTLLEPLDGASLFISGSSGLTFLGTLAVLGVALAVIMLLIYVIVSFIRLRG